MRSKVLVFAASFLLIANSSVGISQAQTAATSSLQAANMLAQSAKALTGTTTINDLTLSGTVRRIVGPDDEAGTVTYKAVQKASRLEMAFASGNHSELRSSSGPVPTGQWSGPDGVFHPIADQNLLIDPIWFPTFVLTNFAAAQNSVITYVGSETIGGTATIHIAVSQQFPDVPGENATLLQRLSQVDLYLNPSTLLPIEIRFDSHPDNDAMTDILTEVSFSDYRTIGGVQIPFHVQKSVNGSLTLDLQFQNASLNTGLTLAQLTAQ